MLNECLIGSSTSPSAQIAKLMPNGFSLLIRRVKAKKDSRRESSVQREYILMYWHVN